MKEHMLSRASVISIIIQRQLSPREVANDDCRTMLYPRDAPRIAALLVELEAAPASSEGWASCINRPGYQLVCINQSIYLNFKPYKYINKMK